MRKRKMPLPGRIAVFILLVFFFAFAIFPIYWITVTSLKPPNETVSVPIQYWPQNFTFKNYGDVFRLTEFPIFFKNSLVVAVSVGVFTVVLAVLAAYPLARFKFRGKNLAMLLFLITQMIPTIVMIVPLFILFNRLGLLNTLGGLIIPYTVTSIPFCALMMMGFFKQVPPSLEEAAMVDGCGRLGSLLRVVMPVVMPGVAATFVFAFIAAWNELFFGIMFINSEANKTIPAGISIFIQKVEVNWAMMTASAVIAMLPVLLLFIFIQKYLVQGLSAGAVKG